MTGPSGQPQSSDSGDTPDPLAHALASLTRADEASADLFAKAWDQVQAQKQTQEQSDPPRVFVLRRWLAPVAVAATLTLVGLAATINLPPIMRRSVGPLAMNAPSVAAPRLAEKQYESESAQTEALNADLSAAASDPKYRALDPLGSRGGAGSSARDDTAGRRLAFKEGDRQELRADKDKSLAQKADEQAPAYKLADELKKEAKDTPAPPGAPAAKAEGRQTGQAPTEQAPSEQAPSEQAKPDQAKPDVQLGAKPQAAEAPRKNKSEPQPDAKPSSSAPADEKTASNKFGKESAEQATNPPPAAVVPPAPATGAPQTPAITTTPDLFADKRQPAPAPPAQVLPPGGSSAQDIANSQFRGRQWHDQNNLQQNAPGPEAVGRLKSTPRSGYGQSGFDFGRQAPSEAGNAGAPGLAQGPMVRGWVVWAAIVAVIVAFTLYWRRRLRRAADEPTPEQ